MGKTFNCTKMRKLKTLAINQKKELNPNASNSFSFSMAELSDPIIRDALAQFWQGNLRHGNNRRTLAKLKVYARKSNRCKLKQEMIYE
jgi:hypothetical protein